MNWCTKYYIVRNEKYRSIILAVACQASSWLELYHWKLLPSDTNHNGILNALEIYLLCLKGKVMPIKIKQLLSKNKIWEIQTTIISNVLKTGMDMYISDIW
jgi:hypothetical protein